MSAMLRGRCAGNVDTGPASQAVLEQSRVTSRANLLAKLRRGGIAVACIYVRARGLLASDVEMVAIRARQNVSLTTSFELTSIHYTLTSHRR